MLFCELSPDGRVDAVLIETNGGATTSFGYGVHLVPTGEASVGNEVASLYGATRSACAYGVNLRWAGASRLIVEYQQAQQAKAADAELERKKIVVQLKAGNIDPNAPCGGIEHNLRARRRG
jgi:hypothetical protein